MSALAVLAMSVAGFALGAALDRLLVKRPPLRSYNPANPPPGDTP